MTISNYELDSICDAIEHIKDFVTWNSLYPNISESIEAGTVQKLLNLRTLIFRNPDDFHVILFISRPSFNRLMRNYDGYIEGIL